MTNWPQSDWLAARTAASPDALAVIDADATDAGETARWSYADLDAATDAVARSLAARGVGPGDHVGTLLDTGLPFVLIVHAVDRLGAVLVPLNVRHTSEELARACEKADVTTILCDADAESSAGAAAEIAEEPPAVVSIDADGFHDSGEDSDGSDEDDNDGDGRPLPSVERSPADVRVLLSTSGTTGEPKVVPLTAGNLLASAVASAFRLGVLPDDRWLCCLPMYHMGGLAPVLRSTLYGTTVVLQSEFDAERTPAVAREHEATGVSLVPTMLRRIVDSPATLPDSLRFVLLGGAPADAELIEACQRREIPVHPTFGMTETASQVATATPSEAFEHEGTVGRPLVGTRVTVVDEAGDPVQAGERGELVVDGPTVTPGYYGDAAATEASFGPYGLLTGDVGYRDEGGRLWVLNRRDDRIVTGGENVDPGEVVAALREHPAIGDAAVLGVDDPEWGERVGAIVVPADDADGGAAATLGAEAVREHCRERLAGYKLPRTVAFADELPRTASGTVDREAARALLDEKSDD
ncbi:O-succinylbenzoic acid--CoA ligase [Natronoarchaeum philippinense]|uniref:O-succinylbenzoic acid--CoA ligase n=1 Tax=Natronoarchaeum philippinense TaxID=558529 RepID=A0A285N7Q1_NATPI|nr:class I adenylate-forming enzyme family protein [Natronoarchaeum philippinense]SNZ04943.1 O-succinylbenzoic acid--CoA ligase [Natronoarchaeum philippinense]